MPPLCIPNWSLPLGVLALMVLVMFAQAVAYREGYKAAFDEHLTKMSVEWLKLKSKIAERYMTERAKEGDSD